MLIDNSATEKENILNLLNEVLTSNSKDNVTLEDIDISQPEALNTDLVANTKVIIRNARGKTVLTNPINFTYSRLSLPEVFKRKTQAMGSDPLIDPSVIADFDSFTDDNFKEILIGKFILNKLALNIEVSTSGNTKTAVIKPLNDGNNFLYTGQISYSITKQE